MSGLPPIDFPDARILIVDDQESNIAVVDGFLRRAGYQAPTATTDPENAAALFVAGAFDLVILDLLMPRKDGYTVFHELKDAMGPVPVPVMILTADTTSWERCWDMGARNYCNKPILDAVAFVRDVGLLILIHRQAVELHEVRRALDGSRRG
jgi:two-component system, cell cycle response regulator